MLGDNLPPAHQVIALYNQNNIRRLRLYDTNQAALQALGGTDIEVIMGVPNVDLPKLAASQANANSWVQTNVKNYANVKFRYIAVGNEVNAASSFAQYVLPTMQNIYNATSGLGTSYPEDGLELHILHLQTLSSLELHLTSIKIINFLVKTGGPACFNTYPYFAYSGDTKNIQLDYALGTLNGVVIQDGPYWYKTPFDAMVDAAYSALDKAGGGSLPLVVTETGWPSAAGVSTTVKNARIYNSKLIELVNGGTPRKPLETYIFAMFDENHKTSELQKHWGLFSPINKTPKYSIRFT